MPASTKKGQGADAVAIRLQLNGAEDERHVRSWFSRSTKNVTNQGLKDHEDDVEDDTLVGENDETIGLGYVDPIDQLPGNPQSVNANEKLRKQLLGSSAGNSITKGRFSNKPAGLQASKPKPQPRRAPATEPDDEDDARTSSITRKATKNMTIKSASATEAMSISDQTKSSNKRGRATRSANYLDEILAERASKQKKRKKG